MQMSISIIVSMPRCCCRQLEGSSRKLWQAANILIFGVSRADKKNLSHHVSFDATINLTAYMHADSPEMNNGVTLMYELVAVAVHVGVTCNAGHYLGYCNANAGSGGFLRKFLIRVT